MKGNTISTFLEVLKQKQSPAEPGGTDYNWPLERRETEQHSEDMSGTKNYNTLSKEQESYHGSRVSRTFNKSSAVCRRWLKEALLTLWTPWYNKLNHPSQPRCSLPSSGKIQDATSGSIQWCQGSSRSSQHLQKSNGAAWVSRFGTMQGFFHHIKRPSLGLV